MVQKLIIIRGNSGSGKSTIAKQLRYKVSQKTMVLPQDVLRREILKVEDTAGNPVIGLIEKLALYGKDQGYDVIIEGILAEKKYGEVLRGLCDAFDASYVYYLEVPFEETLRRHQGRPQSRQFGEVEMRAWWLEGDYLHTANEKIIDHTKSVEQIISTILEDVQP